MPKCCLRSHTSKSPALWRRNVSGACPQVLSTSSECWRARLLRIVSTVERSMCLLSPYERFKCLVWAQFRGELTRGAPVVVSTTQGSTDFKALVEVLLPHLMRSPLPELQPLACYIVLSNLRKRIRDPPKNAMLTKLFLSAPSANLHVSNSSLNTISVCRSQSLLSDRAAKKLIELGTMYAIRVMLVAKNDSNNKTRSSLICWVFQNSIALSTDWLSSSRMQLTVGPGTTGK
jgi:hypothetical protein